MIKLAMISVAVFLLVANAGSSGIDASPATTAMTPSAAGYDCCNDPNCPPGCAPDCPPDCRPSDDCCDDPDCPPGCSPDCPPDCQGAPVGAGDAGQAERACPPCPECP